VKFQLIETDAELIAKNEDRFLARGTVEKIGTTEALIRFQSGNAKPAVKVAEVLDHKSAIGECLNLMRSGDTPFIGSANDIGVIGHRVVHGGEKFSGSQLMTDAVVEEIRECIELKPLHNPHNLKGHQVCQQLLPEVPQVAVFDTAFHPNHAASGLFVWTPLPALPSASDPTLRVPRHVSSFCRLPLQANLQPAKGNNQFDHLSLGNGCSVCAIEAGRSVDTSMGFTPLGGLVMGTRCGDLDPAIILYVMTKEDLSVLEATTLLNKHSGLSAPRFSRFCWIRNPVCRAIGR
jgi:acetate kinase